MPTTQAENSSFLKVYTLSVSLHATNTKDLSWPFPCTTFQRNLAKFPLRVIVLPPHPTRKIKLFKDIHFKLNVYTDISIVLYMCFPLPVISFKKKSRNLTCSAVTLDITKSKNTISMQCSKHFNMKC